MRGTFAGLLCLSLIPGVIFAEPLLDFSHTESAVTDSSTYVFTFTLSKNNSRLIMNVDSKLEQGTLSIWFGGGGYQVIGNYTNDSTFIYENLMFGPLNNTEPIQVRISTFQAMGEWHITFTEFSPIHGLIGILISGLLIFIVAGGCLVWWKRSYHESMKWVWIGGGIWASGVVLKFIFAILANGPILVWIKQISGPTGYLTIGSIYIGSLTGIFEIGITLVFALILKTMTTHPSRAIGIGIGAGAIEAILIGFSQIGNFAFILSNAPGSTDVVSSLVQTMNLNPVFFLLAPVERLITIFCHTSSRVLTLYAVIRRKYIYFWAGFFIMTAIDSIAGYVHLAGLLDKMTMWWIELAILPFALVSIPIIKWCVTNWPAANQPSTVTTRS